MKKFEIVYTNNKQKVVTVTVFGYSAIVEENNFKNENSHIIDTFHSIREIN